MDMNNFQKYMTKPTFYKQSSYPQEATSSAQYRTQSRTQTTNFLGKTYQKKMTQPVMRRA